MSKDSKHRFDVLVVGGGPAGMAAAARAVECGAQIGIVDDNPNLGGQIWRERPEDGRIKEAEVWRSLIQKKGVTVLSGKRIFERPEAGLLYAEGTGGDLQQLRYRKLVLATGARERFLPFPGWTLPNVMGAGGLQALVKSGFPIQGKRIVVAGTGPLLLAVAAYLRQHGAEILAICEQASWSKLTRFSAALINKPEKIFQAFRLKKEIGNVPLIANCWPLAAYGRNAVEKVTISRAGKPRTIECDYLACGFHLVPNTELPQLLGCQMQSGYVQVDKFQQTTVPEIFCAGEPTGIGGVELSLVEGQIAGLAATGRAAEVQKLFGLRDKLRRFARLLDQTFCLRQELRTLPSPETIVCRCEDVPHSRLQKTTSWRAAKLHTRCGMGPCQGRICGPITRFLFQWHPDSVRPPLFPVAIENLAAHAVNLDTGGIV
jgi:D-hydroxyproline dehydrogenase subunit alpha